MHVPASSSKETFFNTSRNIVKKFLQSVVIIDDKATFEEPVDVVGQPLIVPRPRGTRNLQLERVQLESPPTGPYRTNTTTNDDSVNVKRLNDCFAELGLVCSVLRPTKEETTALAERADHVARRADIIVFDWILNSDEEAGATALESILKILSHDKSIFLQSIPQSRTRLIVVYTSEPDLESIVKKTSDYLNVRGLTFQKKGGFILFKEGVRIVFYKKSRGSSIISRKVKQQVLSEEQLTEKLLDDFTDMTQGLLSNVALASLGALRENTYRILSKFNRKLDAPYLSHRATSDPTNEVQQHPIPLLTSEFDDVLRDCKIDSYTSMEIIESWLDYQIERKEINLKDKVPSISPEDLRNVLIDLVKEGIEKELNKAKSLTKSPYPEWKKFLNPIKTADSDSKLTNLINTVGKSFERDLDFAMLTTLRSRYDEPLPKLTLGTIIKTREGRKVNYYVCVQPECDSVRLKEDTPFLFIRLYPVENKSNFNIVFKEKNKYKKFKIKFKSKDVKLFMMLYQDSGEIEAERGSREELYFKVKGSPSKLFWVVNLKNAHAQRIINNFASDLSRVGLMESDWLRRMAG